MSQVDRGPRPRSGSAKHRSPARSRMIWRQPVKRYQTQTRQKGFPGQFTVSHCGPLHCLVVHLELPGARPRLANLVCHLETVESAQHVVFAFGVRTHTSSGAIRAQAASRYGLPNGRMVCLGTGCGPGRGWKSLVAGGLGGRTQSGQSNKNKQQTQTNNQNTNNTKQTQTDHNRRQQNKTKIKSLRTQPCLYHTSS